MRLQDLNVFLQVAEQGSLHRAAEHLGLTQSALSKVLARLERKIGMQVFERTPRGVALTEAGRTLAHHAEKVTLAVSDLESELGDQRVARAGSVRLGTLPYLQTALLSPVFSNFFINRPLATFSIEAHLSARLISLLQSGQVDMVLAATPETPPPDLEYLPLGMLTMQIVARADHPRRHEFVSMADLAQERWAMPAASLYLRQWLEERFTTIDLPAPRLAVESTASPVAFAELLRETELLGLMPEGIMHRPEGHGLRAIDGPGMTWRHEVSVFWRKGGYLSPICRDFRDALLAHCQTSGF